MESFFTYLKTEFIDTLNQKYFPRMVKGELKEFTDSKSKKLSTMFEYGLPHVRYPKVTFFLHYDQNDCLVLRISAGEEIKHAFLRKLEQELIVAAEKFHQDCLITVTMQAVRWKNKGEDETPLYPVGERAKKIHALLTTFDTKEDFYVWYNTECFALKNKENTFDSFFDLHLAEGSIELYSLEERNGNYEHVRTKTISSVEEAKDFLLHLEKETGKIRSWHEALLHFFEKKYPGVEIETMQHGCKRLLAYGYGIGVGINYYLEGKPYGFFFMGKTTCYASIEEASKDTYEKVEKHIKKLRLKQMFQSE